MVTSELISEDRLEKIIRVLKVLGHNDRLQIVNILLKKECHVSNVENILGAKQPHTSSQLKKLKIVGILKSRRDANKTYYSLANKGIRRIVKSIIAGIS